VSLEHSTVADIDFFFELQQDPEAVWMAAFTSTNLADREAFEARWTRVLDDPTILVRTVLLGGERVGQVLKHVADGQPEVSYWISRQHWGRGLATAALRLLLDDIGERPVYARVAQDNVGSLRVLLRNGFSITGANESPAAARGEMLKEYVLMLAG
jgi:RimJ/RimL family protein N-acetyltransferase